MDDVAELLRFDPDTATVIREPEGVGYGYWVGAPKVSHDPDTGLFVLSYRVRSPLEHGRGGVARVATSADGITFDDVWEASKAEILANSIEAGHCVRHDDHWRLYLSYELDGARPYWRVDVIEGPTPADLDTQGRRTVLLPLDYGRHSIKDPWVLRTDEGGYRIFVTTDPRDRPERDGDVIHAMSRDATAVAESDDGLVFPALEYVLDAALDGSWHGRRARVNGLFPYGDVWVGHLRRRAHLLRQLRGALRAGGVARPGSASRSSTPAAPGSGRHTARCATCGACASGNGSSGTPSARAGTAPTTCASPSSLSPTASDGQRDSLRRCGQLPRPPDANRKRP
ncbi:MAG: hypothetical protein U5R31_07420 [Acidimicrobiia bacterium]|nr:hypothetical protein [Acidimicrobiia bacterium]